MRLTRAGVLQAHQRTIAVGLPDFDAREHDRRDLFSHAGIGRHEGHRRGARQRFFIGEERA